MPAMHGPTSTPAALPVSIILDLLGKHARALRPEEQGIVHEPHSIYRPEVAPVWVSILQQIIVCLDAMGTNFNCINPFC